VLAHLEAWHRPQVWSLHSSPHLQHARPRVVPLAAGTEPAQLELAVAVLPTASQATEDAIAHPTGPMSDLPRLLLALWRSIADVAQQCLAPPLQVNLTASIPLKGISCAASEATTCVSGLLHVSLQHHFAEPTESSGQKTDLAARC